MKFWEIVVHSLENLRRNKLRASLTILGVVIGIGALSSMLSFGAGMEKSATESILNNDIFTMITITKGEITDILNLGDDIDKNDTIKITHGTVKQIEALEHIDIAYTSESFVGQLKYQSAKQGGNITVLPSALKDYPPYYKLYSGKFLSNDSAKEIVLSLRVVKRLKLTPNFANDSTLKNLTKNQRKKRTQDACDSLIGKNIVLKTVVLDTRAITMMPWAFAMNQDAFLKDTSTNLRIVGIMDNEGISGGFLPSTAIIAPIAANKIPKMGISNIGDILKKNGRKSKELTAVYARIDNMQNIDEVKMQIEDLGFNVFSLIDKLEDMKNFFLIFNSFLGIIGTIALIVAALGIINTMLMSIMERRKEIGIMKSIGAYEGQIRQIFLIEALVIGFIGGIFGLILGYIVTRIALGVLNVSSALSIPDEIQLFYFPAWIIIGSMAFSILVSIIAGLYPAHKAAQVDPVEAMRYE